MVNHVKVKVAEIRVCGIFTEEDMSIYAMIVDPVSVVKYRGSKSVSGTFPNALLLKDF